MRRSITTFVLVFLALLVGCGTSYRSLRWNTPDDTALRYSFETVHDLETTLETLPADAASGSLEAIEEKLSRQTIALSGGIEKRKAQYFRDATSGFVVTLTSVEGGQREADGALPLDAEGLIGKSVSIRAFDSGEIFEMLGFEHFAGYGRFGDLFPDLFAQLMMRLPPKLPEAGTTAVVSSRVPIQMDPLCKVEHSWEVEFRHDGETSPCHIGQRCLELRYDGWIKEDSFNAEPRHVTEVVGTGTIRGTMLLALDKMDFQEHRYTVEIDRTIRTFEEPFDRRKGEQGTVRAVVLQHDHAETVIRRER